MLTLPGGFGVDLSRPLGSGGAGRVWAGTHGRSGVPVAVKVVPGGRDRVAEVRAQARLDHPGILRVFDGFVVEGSVAERLGAGPRAFVVVMELAEGGALAEHARAEHAADTLRQMLDALGHAHARGVVHLDLSPRNVLWRTARRRQIRLADFGLARRRGERAAGAGTPGFMAPEQRTGGGVGPWTDLFAVGRIAAWLTGGESPWTRRLSASTPGARFPSAAAAKAALGAAATLAPAAGGGPPRRGLAPTRPVRAETPEPAGEAGIPGANTLPLPERRPTGLRRPLHPAWRPRPGRNLLQWRLPTLVGRASELDRLWESLVGVARGAGGWVDLSGPPGCGGTRVAETLAHVAEETGAVRVARVHGDACPVEAVLAALHHPAGPAALAAPLQASLAGAVDAPVFARLLRAASAGVQAVLLVLDGAPADAVARVRAALAQDPRLPVLVVTVGAAGTGGRAVSLAPLPDVLVHALVHDLDRPDPLRAARIVLASRGLPGRAVALLVDPTGLPAWRDCPVGVPLHAVGQALRALGADDPGGAARVVTHALTPAPLRYHWTLPACIAVGERAAAALATPDPQLLRALRLARLVGAPVADPALEPAIHAAEAWVAAGHGTPSEVAMVRRARARQLRFSGDVDGARALLAATLAAAPAAVRGPVRAQLHLGLAAIADDRADPAAAEAHLDAAAACDPDPAVQARIAYRLGASLLARGRLAGAAEALARAERLSPEWGDGRAYLLLVRSRLAGARGAGPESARLLAEATRVAAMEMDPMAAAACALDAGERARARGERAVARDAYLRALELYPRGDNSEAAVVQFNLALMDLEEGILPEPDVARGVLRFAREVNAGVLPYALALGLLAEGGGDATAALAELRALPLPGDGDMQVLVRALRDRGLAL